MDRTIADILDEARAQIARGLEPDAAALERRVREVDPGALPQLRRLLAVHRAKRSLQAPPAPPVAQPKRGPAYRAKPTIAGTMTVRAREHGGTVALEWEPRREVARWEARVAERPDPRRPYVDRETVALEAPRLELQLTDHPQRVHLSGRNAAGRVVQRALISGLTRDNWRSRWLQRPTAS